MRSNFEICDALRDDGIDAVTKEELYYCLLVELALSSFASHDIRELGRPELNALSRSYLVEENFRREKTAGGADPQRWLGRGVPGDPEYDRDRRLAKAIFAKVQAKHGRTE